MKLGELLAIKGIHIAESKLRKIFDSLYLNQELLAYVVFKTSEGAQSHAFVFQGQKVWYAMIDGYRTTVKKAVRYIKSAEMKGDVVMSKELTNQLLMEEL